MRPALRIFIKLIAILICLLVILQINNSFCIYFNKCRPFLFSYYYQKLTAKKEYNNLNIITNYKLINANKYLYVTTDFDKTTSLIGEIVKIKLIYKNLTNQKILAKNNFSFDNKISNKFVTMIKCPCSSKIIIEPNSSKILELEFFYHVLVRDKTLDELKNFLIVNTNLIENIDKNSNQLEESEESNLRKYITNNMTLIVN